MRLDGGAALVTGGATGIGRATCLALAAAGIHSVALGYNRSAEAAEQTAQELVAAGCDVLPVQADVADEADVLRMVAAATRQFGRLDLLVNSAGTTRVIPYADLEALTAGVWDEVLSVNLMGTFFACRAAAGELSKASGAIVNVASLAGMGASGSSIPYAVSKAAVIQLTRSLAVALAPSVRVNAVAPGLVATGWFRERMGEDFAAGLETAAAAQTPLGRVTTAEDVAQSVLGLVQSEMVTGQVLVVDGGRVLTS